MALSTSVKFTFWALLITLATLVMAEEIVYTEAGIAVKANETEDLFSQYFFFQEWSEDLERFAQSHSNKCVFKHSSDQARSNFGGFSYVGENLYTTTGTFKPADVVQSWYDEVDDYDYDSNYCPERKMCGHYTQVVWAESRTVGCAVKFCSNLGGINWKNAYLITCNYGPGGNYPDQKPYKLGAACSQCPKNRRRCANDLCV